MLTDLLCDAHHDNSRIWSCRIHLKNLSELVELRRSVEPYTQPLRMCLPTTGREKAIWLRTSVPSHRSHMYVYTVIMFS